MRSFGVRAITAISVCGCTNMINAFSPIHHPTTSSIITQRQEESSTSLAMYRRRRYKDDMIYFDHPSSTILNMEATVLTNGEMTSDELLFQNILARQRRIQKNKEKNNKRRKVELEEVTVPSLIATTAASGSVGKRRKKKTSLLKGSKTTSPSRMSRIRKETVRKSRKESSSKTTTDSRNGKNNLLTREEEAEISDSIRAMRAVLRIREDLDEKSDDVSEAEWAKACNLTTRQLFRVLQSGEYARSQLVSANVGLVMSIAKRYYAALKRSTGSGGSVGTILSMQDMIQEGNLGLMEAAERFEPKKGFRFSTYATWWVRQRILQAITDNSRVIRLPGHVHNKLRTIRKVKKEMSKEIGRSPSLPELAHRLQMPLSKLQLYTESSRDVLSLEVPVSSALDDERTLLDKIASKSPTPEDDAETDALRRDIRAVVEGLGDRERDVLIMRFGLDDGNPRTIGETAERLGISQDRVRSVEARALNKLRHPQNNYMLKEYVGVDYIDHYQEPITETLWSF